MYEITTIGSLLGSCECGKDRRIDPQRIAGLLDTLNEVGDKLNPLSPKFLPYDWARSAAAAVEQKVEAAEKTVGAKIDPLPVALDVIGVPTWGYQAGPITVAALVGVAAVGGFVVIRMAKKKRAAGASRTKGKQ